MTKKAGERVNLTKRAIEALKPREAEYSVFDKDVRGFHVRVHPSGVKSFRLKYQVRGKQRAARIGEFSEALTVEQARKKAIKLRSRVENGGDPIADDKAAVLAAAEQRRRAINIETLIERWLVEGREAAPAKREISWVTDASKLRRHIKPLLGDILVRDLTKGDIETAQRKIAQGATAADIKTGFRGRARVTGGRGVARSSIVVLSACLSWAVDQEIISANPCARVKKEKPRSIERFLSEQEAARLFDTITAMETKGSLLKVFGDTIRVLLLTGARKAEIQNLQWSEIDFERGLITLSRERSKTGEKSIVLASAAAQILAARPRVSAFVFPSPLEPSNAAVGLPKAWVRVRREAKLEDVRLHDLRHSFASFAAASGASLHLIGKALGHVQASTTHRYAHLGNDPVRDMAEGVGNKIMGAPKLRDQTGAVIVLRKFD